MTQNIKIFTCKNCGNSFEGNFCNICGQKVITNRFTLKIFIFNVLESVFNFERGFFFTVQQLIKNPEKVISEYLAGRTKIYFNPIKFLIIIAGISALFAVLSNSLDNSVELITSNLSHNAAEQSERMNTFVFKLTSFIKTYLNIVMILVVPFYALGFKFLFSRKKLYYTEHLIINCYAFGIGTLLSTIVSAIIIFIPNSIAVDMASGFIVVLAVYIYFYQRIAGKNLFRTIFSSISSMIIGFILFLIFFYSIIGITVFILIKYTDII